MLLLDIDDGSPDSLLKKVVASLSLHDTVHFIRTCTSSQRVGEIDFLKKINICNSSIVRLLNDLKIHDTMKGELDTHLDLTFVAGEAVSRIEILATFMKTDDFIKSITINQSILVESDRLFADALAANYTLTKLRIHSGYTIQNILSVETRRNLLVELNATTISPINDREVDLLCKYVSQSTCLKSLGLQRCCIYAASASRIADALISNKINKGALTSLDLSDNSISNIGATAIARALPFASISHLNLTNNSISDAGMSSLSTAILGSKTLTSLNLRSNSFSESIPRLTAVIKCKTSITDLDLRGTTSTRNTVTDVEYKYDLASALFDNPTIKKFSGISFENLRINSVDYSNAANADIGLTELLVLSKILIKTNTVKYLNLENNMLDDACDEVLADLLLKSNLETLLLSDNYIRTGVVHTSKALRSNPSLTSLSMMGCGLGDDEAVHLAKAICSNTCLKTLDVSHNDIGRAGEKAIGISLEDNTSLVELCIGNNHISHITNIANALRRNTTLTTLDLRDNRIEDSGAIMLSRAIKSNSSTSIRYLNVQGNNISPLYRERLHEAVTMGSRSKTTPSLYRPICFC